ncbi:uncharacterized protein LOC141611689 [Silene latifolia]|uniref:uncharacterized protein LOC141611689 n=1 Tax=Silene latifolia TaxID=37657 RepID=UPI003D7801A0
MPDICKYPSSRGIHNTWNRWLNCSKHRGTVVSLASSCRANLGSCCPSCCSRSQDCHISSDETLWGLSFNGGPIKCGCIRSYDKASSSLTGWYIRNAQTRQLSHPLPVLRAREIDEWSRGREYTTLLKRATQNSALHKV